MLYLFYLSQRPFYRRSDVIVNVGKVGDDADLVSVSAVRAKVMIRYQRLTRA